MRPRLPIGGKGVSRDIRDDSATPTLRRLI
jgi:hypothetical protein